MRIAALSSRVNMFRRCHFVQAGRVAVFILFAGFLLSSMGSGRLMAQAASGQAVTQTQTRSTTQQAERREEIRQKKIDNPEAEDGANIYRHSPMVHTLAHAIGRSVEFTSRLFGAINFFLLVGIVAWGIARLLPKALRNRTERIRSEIEQAQIATEDANRRLASVEQRLSRLDSEIEAIRTQAEQETVEEEKRLRAALEQEKQAILASAVQDIDAATKNAQSQLKKLAADLVIDHARRQIAISADTDHALIEGFLASVTDTQPRGGVN